MKATLDFNSAHATEYKSATFPNADVQKLYVAAEFSDPACQKAYFNHQASKTLSERAETSVILDATRYHFYKMWARDNLPRQKFQPTEKEIA